MKWLHSILQTKDMYGYVIKSMDEYISFQRIFLFFQKVNIKWNLFSK
jgi:hypothetical protein